ncbi:hypothetical protein Trydic_g1033 [Trypoxylus dichotomus]
MLGIQTARIHIASEMSEFVPRKQHLRVILHYYLLEKRAAETCRLHVGVYDNYTQSEPTCRYWSQRCKSDDFDVNNEDGAPKKFQNKKLFDIVPCLTREELSTALNVDQFTVGKCLYALGMVRKAEN